MQLVKNFFNQTQPMSTVCTPDASRLVLCCYLNHTSHIQVGIIPNQQGENCERVIFPGDKFLFEAPAAAKLEIFIDLGGKTILLERISCSHLQTENLADKTLK